jgi:hypothetical protein
MKSAVSRVLTSCLCYFPVSALDKERVGYNQDPVSNFTEEEEAQKPQGTDGILKGRGSATCVR